MCTDKPFTRRSRGIRRGLGKRARGIRNESRERCESRKIWQNGFVGLLLELRSKNVLTKLFPSFIYLMT